MAEPLTARLTYYGVSPWEIEVLYGFLNSRFRIEQEETAPGDDGFVSSLDLDVPLAFDERFFEWFEFRRWDKVKAVLKEMKRRRGSGNALRVRLRFAGSPGVTFTVDAGERRLFDNAVEKIDFVLELLPYHLDPQRLPAGASSVSYRFDPESARWRLDSADVGGRVRRLGGGAG